jgi:hypothetical protein
MYVPEIIADVHAPAVNIGQIVVLDTPAEIPLKDYV